MSEISRREFFRKTAADAAVVGILASAGVKLYANPLGLPIGSQTYPHRQLIKDGNFADLLKTLKEIGVERIELCSAIGYADFANLADGKAVKKTLDDHGLKCESAHFSMKELRESQDKSIAWAKEIGMRNVLLGLARERARLSYPYRVKVALTCQAARDSARPHTGSCGERGIALA